VSPLGRVSSRVDPLKEPQEDDNEEMLLWRATVDSINNIGEPYAAEWVYPEGRPSPSRFEIQQNVQRYMMLSYDNPGSELSGVGWWIPGQRDEYVYFPTNSGEYHDFVPSAYVSHDPVPLGRELNRQFGSPIRHNLILLGELEEEWVNFLTQQLYRKGTQYVRNFINRYVITKEKYSQSFTREDDRRLRNNIVKIFKDANNEDYDMVEDYVWNEWQQRQIYANPENGYGYDEYNSFALDPNFLNDDTDLGILYNKKGVRRVPANKAELATDFKNVQQYDFKIKKSPAQGTRRRRQERKRDKKILKEYQEEMRVIGENPSAVYDGGRRRSTRRNKRAKK
jgi:hypothetical protein